MKIKKIINSIIVLGIISAMGFSVLADTINIGESSCEDITLSIGSSCYEDITPRDLSKGFVVKGEDTADFLREKLLYMGLTSKEAQEFIIYWLPKMENNPYNLITFQDDIYTENAKLDVTPQPDSLLRIFMTYKSLETPIEIEEQELFTFDRNGFVAIEWGGVELKIVD